MTSPTDSSSFAVQGASGPYTVSMPTRHPLMGRTVPRFREGRLWCSTSPQAALAPGADGACPRRLRHQPGSLKRPLHPRVAAPIAARTPGPSVESASPACSCASPHARDGRSCGSASRSTPRNAPGTAPRCAPPHRPAPDAPTPAPGVVHQPVQPLLLVAVHVTPKRAARTPPASDAASSCVRRLSCHPPQASPNRIFRISCSSSVRLMGHLLIGRPHETGQSTCYYTGQTACS